MINETLKTKAKIFFITFFLLTVLTNYYESRNNIIQNKQSTPNKSVPSVEKGKADAALTARSGETRKQQNNELKTEEEYAEIIKNNLEKNCNFWKNQYILSKKAEDKLERDNACRLVNRYFQ